MKNQLTLEISSDDPDKAAIEPNELRRSRLDDNATESSDELDTIKGENPPQERQSRTKPANRPKKQIIELALRIKVEELQLKYRNLLIYCLAGLTLFTLVALYGVYAYNRSQSKIEKNYNEVGDLLTLAYKGDSVAHQEIVRRYPILTRKRLPRTLRSVEAPSNPNRSNSSGSSNLSVQGDSGIRQIDDSGSSFNLVGAPSKAIGETDSVNLYAKNKEKSVILGAISSDSDIISIKRKGEWSEIMLSTGIPVWVNSNYVYQINESLVRVTGDNVNLRVLPKNGQEFIFGAVNSMDTLQLIEKQLPWLKVYTPADYQVWVKNQELDRLLY